MGSVTALPIMLRRAPAPSLAAPPPLAAPPAMRLPSTQGRRGEYAIADVARPLGLLDRAPRTIIETLRALAKHDGMPLPRTPRVVSGRPIRGERAICKASLWDAGEFDAWLDGRGPGGPAGAQRAPLAAPLRADMAERARQMAAAR